MAVTERSAQTPLYEEIVQGYAFRGAMIAIGIFITVILPMMIIHRLRDRPSEHIPFVVFVILALLLSITSFCYFGMYPLKIKVDGRGLTLRSGQIMPFCNRAVPFSCITAIQRGPYKPLEYDELNRRMYLFGGTQVWKMNGNQVLEIVLQDSRRIIILSSRVDQLASLLHEMTHVPVEDCR